MPGKFGTNEEAMAVTGIVNISPIPEGQCDAIDCADFIIKGAQKSPNVEQRDQLICALRKACISEVGCQMGSAPIDELIDKMPEASNAKKEGK